MLTEKGFYMYHSILVPLDGSQIAEEALPLALSIANRAGAGLEIMRVHDICAVEDPHCGWAPYNPAEDAMLMKQEQAYLDAVTRRLGSAATVPVTSALVVGLVVDRILDHVRIKPADLVVMTAHGRGPMSRFWLGSVADELVRHAPVPILMVRPRDDTQGPEAQPTLRRMLIPLDGSEFAKQVREPAIALGSLMDAEYVLIRAVESRSPSAGPPVAAERKAAEQPRLEKQKAEAQAYLDGAVERLRAEGFRVRARVVVAESVAAAVLEAARDENIDVIAVATHARSGFKRLLLGSVADKIVRGALTPVLVYQPMPHK
jgi:nucleotide-binding universal stress UspA family protein